MMNHRCLQLACLLIVFMLCAQTDARAQLSVDNGVSNAMGNSGAAFMGGFLALDVNPARLAAKEFHPLKLTVGLAPVGLAAYNNAFSINAYNRYFGRDSRSVPSQQSTTTWTQQDKDGILSLFGDALQANVNFSATWLGAAYHISETAGSIGFFIRDYAGVQGQINKTYIDLALNGNANLLGQLIPSNGSEGRAWWHRYYGASYARDINLPTPAIKNFLAGITLKYVQGFAVAQLDNTSTIFNSASGDSLAARLSYQLRTAGPREVTTIFFPQSSGGGFGFDLGLSADVREGVTLALALNDVGSVSYSTNSFIRRADTLVSFTGFRDPIDGTVNQNQVDSLRRGIEGTGQTAGTFNLALPTHLRLGAAVDLEKFNKIPLVATLDWVQGFNNSYGNTTSPLVGLGFEYRGLKNIPLRAGVRLGGNQNASISFGFGFDTPNAAFDVSTRNLLGFLSPSSAQHLALGLGLRIRVVKPDEVLSPDELRAPMRPMERPLPTINFVAAKNALVEGDTTLLVWTVVDADDISIQPDIGKVAAQGSFAIKPPKSTSYILTATNPTGTLSAQVTVRVVPPSRLVPLPKVVPDVPLPDVFKTAIDEKKGGFTIALRRTGIEKEANAALGLYQTKGFTASLKRRGTKKSPRFTIRTAQFKTRKEALKALKMYRAILPKGASIESVK